MVTLTFGPGTAVFEVEGFDKLWALKSRLQIPLEHITGARIDNEIARGWWHGLKLGGSSIPGILTAGTFYRDGGWVFWDVHDPDRTIVVDLAHEHYRALVIQVEDPAAAVGEIQRHLTGRTT